MKYDSTASLQIMRNQSTPTPGRLTLEYVRQFARACTGLNCQFANTMVAN